MTEGTSLSGPDYYRLAHGWRIKASQINNRLEGAPASEHDLIRDQRDHAMRQADWHTAQAQVAATALSALLTDVDPYPAGQLNEWRSALNGK